MVYSARKIEVNSDTFVVVRNTPFEQFPRLLIEVFDFDVDRFYQVTECMNKSFWNLSIVKDGEFIATSWGIFFPLEDTLLIHRLGMLPEFQHSDMLHALIDMICQYGEELGANLVVMVSDKADAWLRLTQPKAELSKVKVLERKL